MIKKCGCVFLDGKLIQSCSEKHQEKYDMYVEEKSNKGSSLTLNSLSRAYEAVIQPKVEQNLIGGWIQGIQYTGNLLAAKPRRKGVKKNANKNK